MLEPGCLTELGADGQAAWHATVMAGVAHAVKSYGANPQLRVPVADDMTEVTAPDWGGFPARVGSCLTRRAALAVLDWTGASGAEGRQRLQEEYLEWRVQRDADGNILAVELTCELAAYWQVLAAHQPNRVLELVACFAGESAVPATAVFGPYDPFAADATAQLRAKAFAREMLDPQAGNPYNNGLRAICCMVQPTNTLQALLSMAVAAAIPRVVRDPVSGRVRPMHSPEATPLVRGACQDGRSSDPVLLERLGRLAFEGRTIGFDDPLGVYIQSVQLGRLRCPDGRPVPASWLTFSRGLGPDETADGRSRYQRLRLAVPDSEDFCVSQLIDVATETPIRFGGQVAELVQLAVYLRVSARDAVEVDLTPQRPGDPTQSPAEAAGCEQVRRDYRDFAETGSASPLEADGRHGEAAGALLQRGIYFAAEQQAPAAYRLLLMNVKPGVTAADVHRALARIYQVLTELATGAVRELGELSAVQRQRSVDQFSDLQTLIGFGRRLFDGAHHDPPVTVAARPDYLAYLPPDPGPFPALRWIDDREQNAEADIAFQLTAAHQASVDWAAVELASLVAEEDLALTPTCSFGGFGRSDGRGWLGFHDGVSNMESPERVAAIEANGDPAWMAGGTYMAVLRCQVELEQWRKLRRSVQELLVGRDKRSGGGLTGTKKAGGETTPIAADPPPDRASDQAQADYIDPPQTTQPVLEDAHIHRANQNRTSAHAAGSLRIFRQGYEFLDAIGPSGSQLGLNFVSFQRNLGVLQALLHLPGWLGDVNFGGSARAGAGQAKPPEFIRLRAGGLYAVPPRDQPFPGAGLFTGDAQR